MNIEIGDSVKIVNAIDPIKMVVIDKIDNEHLTAVYWSHTQGAYLTITVFTTDYYSIFYR